MDCALDSTALSGYKIPLDTINGNKRKTTSAILKRGRTIIKRRYDPRKHTLLHDSVKATTTTTTMTMTGGPELHGTKSPDVGTDVSPIQNGDSSLPNNDANDVVPALKGAINLEDKLISGEEIEICPNFRVDDRRGIECVPKDVDAQSTSENSRQRRIPINDEFSKSCPTPDKSAHTSSNESLISADDYPKLYITVASASDKNAVTKSSLLKNIRGIQSSDGNSYGINISNSRFFVPKNYIFSGVECSMDDLKFEVDPEMGKLLQRSYSNPQINTGSPTLVDFETDRASLNAVPVTRGTETLASDETAMRSREDARPHSDTSLVKLKSKESEKVERKQRLFLKKRDSKPRREIVDSLLDEKTSRSKNMSTNRAESSVRPRGNAHSSEEGSSKTAKCTDLVLTSETPHNLETAGGETPRNNRLWTAKHVIIDDREIKKKSTPDATVFDNNNILGTYGGSKKSSTPDNSVECGINSPVLGRSTNTKSCKIKTFHDSSDAPSTRQNAEERDESAASNEQRQRYLKYSNLSEVNRANRMKFLQDSLQTDANEHDYFSGDFNVEKVNLPEDKLNVIDEEANVSRSNADPARSVVKDQDSPFRRTSSLREKYETIVEDVELRTTPGRRPRLAVSCDRKSLVHLSVLWESLQVHRSQSVPPALCVRPGKQRKTPSLLVSST